MRLNAINALGKGLLEGGMIVAVMTGGDRIDGSSHGGHGGRIGEEGESQGGDDGDDERTHCNECGGVKESVRVEEQKRGEERKFTWGE